MSKSAINTWKLLAVLFMISTIAYMIFGFVAQGSQIISYKKKIQTVQKQISAVDKELKDLKDQKKNYKKDIYIEKIARERLKMVKSGELVYIDINNQYK